MGDVRRHAETLWGFHARGDRLSPMAALVCLGSYDLRVAHRTADLALDHAGAPIVVTGAFGNWTRGVFAATEAEVFADILRRRGVPDHRIALETRATNIGENIAYSRRIIERCSGERIVFVTKPQTQARVRATVPIQWPQISAQITAPMLEIDDYADADGALTALIDEMVGDLQRMIAYPALGYQVAVEIPEPVIAAYEALRRAGYTRHCLA
jgi:uncharacterized SAM-binding protein YcdF (DUF218 family)